MLEFIFQQMTGRASSALGITWMILLLTGPTTALGDEKEKFFESKIRPILVEHCYECHSVKHDSEEGGLRLDDREAIREGGDSGPAVVPENLEESLLISAIEYDDDFYQMPPDSKLPDDVIADFRKWVEMGAPDPRDPDKAPQANQKPAIDPASHRSYWAFRPLQADFEFTSTSSQATSLFDARIEQQLQQAGSTPGPLETPTRLVRRAYLTLWGLPPTPDQVAEFVSDDRPDAWPRLIDRLLASPHYGERFGRHWLDVARYADSSGGGRVVMFPDAWRYREYVLDSYNSDQPYQEFVREQIAADLMPDESWEETARRLPALGFLMLGPINYELQDKELLRMEVVDEQIDTIGRSLLGLSLGCARCHDHKFDPILTQDYYALAGIFRSTKSLVPGNVSGFEQQTLPMAPDLEVAWTTFQTTQKDLSAKLQSSNKNVEGLEQRLDELVEDQSRPHWTIDDANAQFVGTWTSSTSVKPYIDAGYHHASDSASEAIYVFEEVPAGTLTLQASYTAHGNRSTAVNYRAQTATGEVLLDCTIDHRKALPQGRKFVSLGEFEVEVPTTVHVVMSIRQEDGVMIADAVKLLGPTEAADDTERSAEVTQQVLDLKAELKRARQQHKETDLALKRLKSSAPDAPVQVMAVREEKDPEDTFVCVRGNVHNQGPIVSRGALQVISDDHVFDIPTGQSGRAELAKWLVDDAASLTHRVYVNRLWHHVFGVGIVSSCDDFGATGSPPVDGPLLDLATQEFRRDGQSSKQFIRRLVTSRAFRVSSQTEADVSDDRTLGRRFVPWRLEAEAIRDSVLASSGQLDGSVGRASFPRQLKSEFGFKFASVQRSVYLPVFRNTLPEVYEVFDFANPNMVEGKRAMSTLSTQALWMMNSPFVRENSVALAERLFEGRSEQDLTELVIEAYQCVLGRPPSEREREIGVEYLSASPENTRARLNQFIQTLYASIEFRYVH